MRAFNLALPAAVRDSRRDAAFPLVIGGDCTILLGERENSEPDCVWPDVADTAIHRIDVVEANAIGPAQVDERIDRVLAAMPARPFWLHLDVDVLEAGLMPAVDSPGSPGIAPADLLAILAPLVARPARAGTTVTVYDPDLAIGATPR